MRSVTVVLNRLFEYSLKLNEYCLCQEYEHKRLDHTNRNGAKARGEHKHTRFGSTVSGEQQRMLVGGLVRTASLESRVSRFSCPIYAQFNCFQSKDKDEDSYTSAI